MIRKMLLLILVGILPLSIYGQLLRTEYYNKLWMKSSETRYYFKREIYKKGSLFQIIDYYRDNVTQMVGSYSSIDPLIENGHFQFYSIDGTIESEGVYNNGLMIGKWKYYDEIGKPKFELDYNLVDTLCDFSPNYMYIQDSIFLDSMPLFKGQDFKAFEMFIEKNIVYPSMASRHYKTGEITALFTINSDGYVCKVSTTGSDNKDLLLETKRVILASPKWKPAIKDGKPIAVQCKCPVRFFFPMDN
jgi:hypothetical protein